MIKDVADLQAILEFWFGVPGSAHYLQNRPEWFTANAEFDAAIREKFTKQVEAALAGQLTQWESCPGGQLALILLTDQFTRNIYRGTERAFSGDLRARKLASSMIAQGWDRARHPIERLFVYLPFEHSEIPEDQERSVTLIAKLTALKDLASFTHYAEEHRNVIRRFGRFPHRNIALGRPSTPDEIAFLSEAAQRG